MTPTLSEQIKALREKRGMSEEQVARDAMLDPWIVAKLEDGDSRIWIGEIRNIVFALGATLEIKLVEEEHK